MSKASLAVTFSVILGLVSCAQADTSSLRSTGDYASDDQQEGYYGQESSMGGSFSSSDECEAPNSFGGGAGGDEFDGYGGGEFFSLAGGSSGSSANVIKPVKPAADNVIVDAVGGPIGSAIVPDSFKASACNAGWLNSSRAEALRIMSSFQSCFHTAKTKRCFVVKREDLIAECQAQYDNDVRTAGLSEGCASYMQDPNTRSQLERSVIKEWIPSSATAQVQY